MSVTSVIGAQSGDEGKGRIVDYIAQKADVAIRYQGGDNAGHTVVRENSPCTSFPAESSTPTPSTSWTRERW